MLPWLGFIGSSLNFICSFLRTWIYCPHFSFYCAYLSKLFNFVVQYDKGFRNMKIISSTYYCITKLLPEGVQRRFLNWNERDWIGWILIIWLQIWHLSNQFSGFIKLKITKLKIIFRFYSFICSDVEIKIVLNTSQWTTDFGSCFPEFGIQNIILQFWHYKIYGSSSSECHIFPR